MDSNDKFPVLRRIAQSTHISTAEEIALAYARKYEGDEAAEWISDHLAEIEQNDASREDWRFIWLLALLGLF